MLRSIVWGGFIIGLTSVSASCKESPPSPADTAAETAKDCDRMAALGTKPWSALEKDRCLGELGSVGPNLRVCFHTCLQKAKTGDDWEECKNECTGFVDHSNAACGKITSDGKSLSECMTRHTALETTNPDRYKCWARCGSRAKTAAEAAACDASCSIPP